MRKIYAIAIVSLVLVVVLVAFVFLFFEKEKHLAAFYEITQGEKLLGYVKIDRHTTEEKVIFRSATFLPENLDYKIKYAKITFARKKFKLEKFSEECRNFGAMTQATYIKNAGGVIDFLGKCGSNFAAFSGVFRACEAPIFRENSLVTYLPFVDLYDFTIGGAQSFDAIYCPSWPFPPASMKLIFTSIKDEYVDVDGKKTKTECITVRAKTLQESRLWVSKWDRTVVKLKTGSGNLCITKVPVPKKITVEGKPEKGTSYDSTNVFFPSGNIALAGTLDIDKEEKKLPAVFLVSGNGPYNRDDGGLYAALSRYLAKNGCIVMRFDRRGIGKSQGDYGSTSLTDEINDMKSALGFLLAHEKADPKKFFIVGHGNACSYLTGLDLLRFPPAGIILLGITKPSLPIDFECGYGLESLKVLEEIDKNYGKTLESMKTQTLKAVKEAKKDYTLLGGNRVFVKKMNEIQKLRPLETFTAIKTSLAMLYGRRDLFVSVPYIKEIERGREKAGLKKPEVIGFRGLNHFFGEGAKGGMIGEGLYKVDDEVLESIEGWIKKICREIDILEPENPPVATVEKRP